MAAFACGFVLLWFPDGFLPSVASGRPRFLKNFSAAPCVRGAESGETLPGPPITTAEIDEVIRGTWDRGEKPAILLSVEMGFLPAGIIRLTHVMVRMAMTVLRDERMAQETSAMIIGATRFAYYVSGVLVPIRRPGVRRGHLRGEEVSPHLFRRGGTEEVISKKL